jgi:hypothetical protein
MAIGSVIHSSRPTVITTSRRPSEKGCGRCAAFNLCAVCQDEDAKGEDPFASMLKVPPADLITLPKRHGGKFPYNYVSIVLRFGPGPTILHGSPDMPTWGTIFQYFDKNNERAVQQRIKNLSDYLAPLQEK